MLLNPYKYLDKSLKGHSESYKKLIVQTYLRVIRLIFFSRAIFCLSKGVTFALFRLSVRKEKEFIKGAYLWGKDIIKMTKTDLKVSPSLNPPEKGHLILLNHVNELDFPFDCYVLQKPFLANQVIKNTYAAYWWMKAMGSQVFDNSKKRTIAISVRNVLKGLENHSYIVYPEGQNTYSEEIRPLKKGMIKLAFDNKIPVYVLVKSGITGFQTVSQGNQIAYKEIGVIKPDEFETWETFRDGIQNAMVVTKKELDGDVNLKQNQNQPV